MTPARRAKIKALAEDARGDAAIRAVAQRLLERYPEPRPAPKSPRQQRVPGVERSPEYLRFVFMDLNRWKRTVKNNFTCLTSYNGTPYRFVLFKFSKTPAWGWRRINLSDDTTAFSQVKYETQAEAHQAAWNSLEN